MFPRDSLRIRQRPLRLRCEPFHLHTRANTYVQAKARSRAGEFCISRNGDCFHLTRTTAGSLNRENQRACAVFASAAGHTEVSDPFRRWLSYEDLEWADADRGHRAIAHD